ncbi:dihydrofolate reductase family protein [Psychrobacillus sp. NEAU-3TGS]|uniref:dihydrofolate reductase family protein n=1 Tax=Psychrobacillus sp. NEAU-3TGS TaxID=2995412 RepID=UPI0024976A43|nr:dihydrofolate reductase family protein [Psychrobacillus sp. NEAU-3TGS]MDI2585617.1 dihydrofolate reductase family protein [Psychrobacillus sp. NEAU-3TGS]
MTNQRKAVMFIATSLDGYIATKDDSLEWLFKVEGEGDNGYSDFYDTVDTVIMGRRTYDWLLEQELESFPYEGKECYVFSRTESQDNENVQFFNGDVVGFTNQLKNKEGKNIWVMGGGDLIHSFMKEELVDELIITVSPVIIGKGIPLFKEIDFETELTLKSVRRFNQFAELRYEVKR